MSIASWFAELVRPCVHMDKTVATMFDDPKDPKVTTIVSECELCGRIKQTVIRAAGVCQHKWETLQRNAVFRDEDDKRPIYHRLEQQCVRCGEVRSVDLRENGK